MKITAVIPVRAGSKRLRNKNILPFGDTNLLIHKIRQLKKVNEIDEIIVSSDSDIMLKMAEGESVNTHKRPLEYADEKTRTFNDVVEYVAKNITGDIMIWAPCVCPLTSEKNYTEALNLFYKFVVDEKKFDSVISVKAFKEYLFGDGKPLNFKPQEHVISQNLPDWKVVVNGFYISFREDAIKRKYLYGSNPYFYYLNKKEAVDIDDEDDYKIALALFDRSSI